MTRVPLELNIQIEDAAGRTYRWGPDEIPANRLRNVSFSTKIGEGFSSAQGQLSRRIDLDYPDLGLVDTVSFVGADGTVAWEGRVSEMPRELSDTHSIGVFLTGWMAHAKDRRFTEIYVDRDLSAWQPMSVRRRANMLGANFVPNEPSQIPDPTTNEAAIETGFKGHWTLAVMSEAWYDAVDNRIARVRYGWNRVGSTETTGTDANWSWGVWLTDDDVPTTFIAFSSLAASGGPVAAADLTTTRRDARFAALSLAYNAGNAGADGVLYGIQWKKIGVYGTHGLTTYEGETGEPPGVRASDVIANIVQRFCPELNIAKITPTSFVIQHLAFKEPVFPYDAFLEINKYHLWNLAVWENKTLHFEPYDLTDYDWQIRTYDPGVEFSPQGPSIDNVFNGMEVIYTDILKRTTARLSPETNSELASADPTNPWNVHGVDHWDTITLSTPSTAASALALGKAALAERNTPKTPGTIKVTGYIKNRLGVEEPAWKVRAGDTIAVTDFPNDEPRLIVETSWDDERKELSISVDRPFALLDAYIDRLGNAVTAKNIG